MEHDNSENPEAEHHNLHGDDTFPNRPEKDERTLGVVSAELRRVSKMLELS